jgi:cyclohexadienyl dehydratase
VITPPSPYHLTPYAYAVRPDDDLWLARMDRFVSDIQRDGRLMSAATRHQLSPMVVTSP